MIRSSHDRLPPRVNHEEIVHHHGRPPSVTMTSAGVHTATGPHCRSWRETRKQSDRESGEKTTDFGHIRLQQQRHRRKHGL